MKKTYKPWSIDQAATALKDNFVGGFEPSETTSWIPESILDLGSDEISQLVRQVLKGQDCDAISTADAILDTVCWEIALNHSDKIQEELDIDFPEPEGVIFS